MHRQVTTPMEKRFKGKHVDALLGEVCWFSSNIFKYENKNAICDATGNATDEEGEFNDSDEEPESKRPKP